MQPHAEGARQLQWSCGGGLWPAIAPVASGFDGQVALRNLTRAREHPMLQRGNAAARRLDVPIIPVFNVSALMSHDHPGSRNEKAADCRHWCIMLLLPL